MIEALSGSSADGSETMLQGWVYVMVYGGFTLQAAGLTTAFVCYARDRWPDLFRMRTAELPVGRTGPLQRLPAVAAAVPAGLYAAVQLYWAFGGTAGIPAEAVADGPASSSVINGVWGTLALVGAAGLLTLVHRRGSGPLRRPLAAAWIGAGSLFAQSLYGLLVVMGQPGGMGEDTTVAAGYTLLAGLLMGLTGAVLLTDRDAAARP